MADGIWFKPIHSEFECHITRVVEHQLIDRGHAVEPVGMPSDNFRDLILEFGIQLKLRADQIGIPLAQRLPRLEVGNVYISTLLAPRW